MTSKVAIVKSSDYNISNVVNAIKEIFSYFDITNIIKSDGAKILIKPNLLMSGSPEKLITTHSSVIEGIIINLKELNIKTDNIKVGDSPGFGTAKGVAESCGIKDVCDRHNVEIIEFSNPKTIKTGINGYKKITIADDAFKYKIINVAKLKAHGQMFLTGAVKNMFGFCIGKRKAYRHLKSRNNLSNFAKMIVKNYSIINPSFSIVDAVTAMQGTGPAKGYAKNMGLIIAGIDAVAVDMVISETISVPANKIPVLQAAKELKIGETNLDNIEILGEKLSEVKINDFKFDFELTEIGFKLTRFIKSNIRTLIAKLKETK